MSRTRPSLPTPNPLGLLGPQVAADLGDQFLGEGGVSRPEVAGIPHLALVQLRLPRLALRLLELGLLRRRARKVARPDRLGHGPPRPPRLERVLLGDRLHVDGRQPHAVGLQRDDLEHGARRTVPHGVVLGLPRALGGVERRLGRVGPVRARGEGVGGAPAEAEPGLCAEVEFDDDRVGTDDVRLSFKVHPPRRQQAGQEHLGLRYQVVFRVSRQVQHRVADVLEAERGRKRHLGPAVALQLDAVRLVFEPEGGDRRMVADAFGHDRDVPRVGLVEVAEEQLAEKGVQGLLLDALSFTVAADDEPF